MIKNYGTIVPCINTRERHCHHNVAQIYHLIWFAPSSQARDGCTIVAVVQPLAYVYKWLMDVHWTTYTSHVITVGFTHHQTSFSLSTMWCYNHKYSLIPHTLFNTKDLFKECLTLTHSTVSLICRPKFYPTVNHWVTHVSPGQCTRTNPVKKDG